jgi:hypothetical protein
LHEYQNKGLANWAVARHLFLGTYNREDAATKVNEVLPPSFSVSVDSKGGDKVVCFDALLEVLILKELRLYSSTSRAEVPLVGVPAKKKSGSKAAALQICFYPSMIVRGNTWAVKKNLLNFWYCPIRRLENY